MQKKKLGAVLGAISLAIATPAIAGDTAAPPAKAEKGKKGGTKGDKNKGGEKACGGAKSCSGTKPGKKKN